MINSLMIISNSTLFNNDLYSHNNRSIFNLHMKVFLDDMRIPPDGWILVKWPDEAIKLLESGKVAEISLDHDLGDDERGTGYDVLLWIEKQVITQGFKPPIIRIHTANVSARQKMEAAVKAFKKKNKDTFEKSGRIFSKDKVEFPELEKFVKNLLKAKYLKEKVKSVKDVKVV